MVKKLWSYLINTFAVNTEGSNVTMLSLVTDTHAKLNNEVADPDILVIFNDLDPVYNAYRLVCINYDMATGDYEGDTLAFEEILDRIPEEIRKWEGGVRAVYFEDTPEERAIFPDKRTPFLQGTYEDRLSAIGTLAEKLFTDPALASTHALVQSFYNSALSSRLAQQSEEGNVGLLSDMREQQRIITAQELYRVLGRLMAKFYQDPTQVERFFDLSLLRETGGDGNDDETPEPEPEPNPATVSIYVYDSNTETPLSGVEVQIGEGENSITVETDDSGNAEVELPVEEATDIIFHLILGGYIDPGIIHTIEPGEDYDLDFPLDPEV